MKKRLPKKLEQLISFLEEQGLADFSRDVEKGEWFAT
jgi:hypothetical protein